MNLNPKSEARNSKQILNSKYLKFETVFVSNFCLLNFEFISDFGFRISDLNNYRDAT